MNMKKLKKATEQSFNRASDLESQGVVTALKAVYYLAKEHLALAKYKSLITLFRDIRADGIEYLKGGESTFYESDYAATEFLEAISDYLEDGTNHKLSAAPFITLLCDESTDIATHKKLAVWARIFDYNLDNPVPETLYICDVPLEKGDGQTIVDSLKAVLSSRSILVSKIMGLGTDGATVMTGQNTGVTGLLLRENPQLLNVHCLAHRVALVTSQAAQSFPPLKDFQQTMTNLFYYFSKSSSRVQTLEEIQKVLNLPVLKIREIHDVRWLSFFEALLSVYRSFPALLAYFESIKKQNDPKAEGIARKLCTRKFIYLTCMLLDVLAPVMVLSQQFQKQDLDPSLVSVHIETCKSALRKVSSEDMNHRPYMSSFEKDINIEEKTYKGNIINMTPQPVALLGNFVKKISENIDSRFPQIDVLSAFGILGMRPISFLSGNELSSWGEEKLDILLQHYGQPKTHIWKIAGQTHSKSVEPFIDPNETKIEWERCKRIVLAEMFPRDNMAKLWQLIIKFHKGEFPNLIKLASLALSCPTNTADCERSFSVQNYITTQRRASISSSKCDQLMRICICGPNLRDLDFDGVAKIWQKKKKRLVFSKKQ